MDILNVKDREETKIESFPYKGKPLKMRPSSVVLRMSMKMNETSGVGDRMAMICRCGKRSELVKK